MAKKTIGFVKLEWVCPNCGVKNPGPQKTCLGCGNPQPGNVAFIKAAQDVLLTDAKELENAKASADVHCPYCGTRNLATSKTCTQCGGDLTGAAARQTGQVLGALQSDAKTIVCPNCAATNLAGNSRCQACGAALTPPRTDLRQEPTVVSPAAPLKKKINPLMIVIPILVLAAICIFIIVLSGQKSDISAVVVNTAWSRSVSIEQYGPVTDTAWRDEIPAGAVIGTCQTEYHHTSDQPEPSSTEVCGTPYVVDDGSGYGEAVQDCIYEVYVDKCEFTTDQWTFFQTYSMDGKDQLATWPEISIGPDQRESSREETYTITFESKDKYFSYTTNIEDEFLEFTPGSEWLLTVNALNSVTDLQPAN